MAEAPVLHRALLLCLFIGLGFSTYAGLEKYYLALTAACSFNPVFSCGGVLTSGHTTFPPGSPIEDWYWGVAGYLVMIAIDIPLIRSYDRRLLNLLFGLSLAGLALAAAFAYTQAFVIGKICIICVGAYLSDVGVVTCGALLLRMRRQGEREEAEGRASAAGVS